MRLILFLLPLIAHAAITNVRISGVTATQAVLDYTCADQTVGSLRVADMNLGILVSSITWASNVATVTTKAPHGLDSGNVVYLEATGVAQWDGWRTLTATATVSTFTFSTTTSGSSSTGSVHPLIHDLNTTLFPGSDLDSRAGNLTSGRARTFVVGKRSADLASDSVRYSRALQRNSEHLFEVTCGGDTATGTFRTADAPRGNTYNDGYPTDPATPGVTAWPTTSWTNLHARYVDPQTGTLLRHLSFPRHSKIGPDAGYTAVEALYAAGTNWTSPTNALLDDANSATYSGATQDVLVLRAEFSNFYNHVDGLQVEIKGCVADGATGTDKDIETSISVNGTETSYFSAWKPITLENETGCTASAQQAGDADPPAAVMSAWLSAGEQPPSIAELATQSGYLATSGTTGTLLFISGGASSTPFGAKWASGSPVHICDDNPCTGTYTQRTVQSLASTIQFTATADMGTASPRVYKAPHLALLIRKRTASAHQIRIQYGRLKLWVSQGHKLNGGSGSTTHCSSTLRTGSDGKSGYNCLTTNNIPANWHLWWIDPSDGERRYRGPVWTSGTHGGYTWDNQILGQSSVAWDSSDPTNDILYGVVNTTTAKQIVIKGVLNNTITDLGPLDSAGGSSGNQWTWTNLTPSPNHISAQILAFDATFEDTVYFMSIVGYQDGKLIMSGRGGQQDSAGWNAVFDLTTNTIVGAMSSWKQMPARYCGIHTPLALNGNKQMLMVGKDLRGGGAYTGPYQTTTTTSLSSGAQSSCETLAPGHPFGTLGNVCASVTVASDTPLSTGTPTNHSLGAMKAGDVFTMPTGGERVRIIAKSGADLVLQRSYSLDYNPVAHSSGAIFRASCGAAHFKDWNYAGEAELWIWWNYTNDPNGTNSADPYGQQLDAATMRYERQFATMSHATHRGMADTAITISDQGSQQPACPASANPISAGYGIRDAAWPNHLLATSIYCIDGNPWFSGQSGHGHGNAVEKHVSFDQMDFTAPPDARKWFIDARPLNIYHDYPQTVSLVTGQLYKVAGYWSLSVDLKKIQFAVKSGDRAVHNVSAPAPFEIPTDSTGNFQFCVAYADDECRPGSLAGEKALYVNIPLATPHPSDYPFFASQFKCFAKDALIGGRDLCVAVLGAHADAIAQYELRGKTDYSGVSSRRITNGLHLPAMTDKLWNTRPLPDGSWTIVMASSLNGTLRQDMMLAKLGPLPAEDSTNRADFIQVRRRVQSVPPGTDNVIAEYGHDASLNCMGKAEACVSATSNNPYWFASESYTGIECSAGCTVQIPVLPQRVVYYRVKYRNASNAVIATGPLEVTAIP